MSAEILNIHKYTINGLFKEDGDDFSLSIETNKIYNFQNFHPDKISLLDYYLHGAISPKYGYQSQVLKFAYQSDWQWLNRNKNVKNIADWLCLEDEAVHKRLDLIKINVLKDLEILAESSYNPYRLEKDQFLRFIVASFLFQDQGLILISQLDISPKDAVLFKYWQLFLDTTTCTLIFMDNIPAFINSNKIITVNYSQ